MEIRYTDLAAKTSVEETFLVLLAYGRHDRGTLFPRAKRQVKNLLPRLKKIVGEFKPGNCLVFHDGTVQAEETVWRCEFPAGANQGEHTFLGSGRHGPDSFEMHAAYRLVQETETKVMVLVVHHRYANKFLAYCLAKTENEKIPPTLHEGDALLIDNMGEFQFLESYD